MWSVLEVKFLGSSSKILNPQSYVFPFFHGSINPDRVAGSACQRDGRCILMGVIIQGRMRKRQVILAHRRY